jgi:DNA-directed RNA polymerase specialized sigma24 family protein
MMGLRQSVTFDGESVPIAKLLIKMIEQRPPVAVTDEIVPDFSLTLDASASLLLPEEAAFYKRYFPGVSLAEIAQRRFE